MDEKAGNGSQYKIKLEQQRQLSVRVVFDVTPDFSESRNVTYKSFDPIHAPGSIMIYQTSGSRVFQVSPVKLVSRTRQEADVNIRTLQTIRTWAMPYFGTSGEEFSFNTNYAEEVSRVSTPDSVSKQGPIRSDETNISPGILGAPPDVLLLSAYSAGQGARINHINRVPVVLTTYNFTYPSECDYISTTDGVPMPIIMEVSITLTETHSPLEYESFSLEQFYAGKMVGF